MTLTQGIERFFALAQDGDVVLVALHRVLVRMMMSEK